MKDILDILAETMLIATFQPRRDRSAMPGFSERLMAEPTRVRHERQADRTRTW